MINREMNEMDIMKNFNVYAIMPFYNELHSSKILTYDKGIFVSTKTVQQLLDEVCICFGADLNGRMKSARRILKKRKNPPIVISEEREMAACQLPMEGYHEPLWAIDLEFKVERVDKNSCHVVFRNHDRFLVGLSEEKVWERRRLAMALLYETKYLSGRKGFWKVDAIPACGSILRDGMV